jgi:tRNA pseudouridine55 synthase
MNEEIVLIDKPAGWTSFDVVAKIRGTIRAEYSARGEKPTKRQLKVGHAGTLDPFATGLLIILLGDATKRADEFLKLDKTYEFTAKLGEVSSTGDPEGEIMEYEKWKTENGEGLDSVIPAQAGTQSAKSTRSESKTHLISDNIPTKDAVLTTLERFTGEITQIPPKYSAIKIDGKRAYKLAREGKEFEVPSRQVCINKLELISYEYPYVKAVCDVSSGTYIRTLVEDIGKALNTGAYCTELRRTRISDFSVVNASTNRL